MTQAHSARPQTSSEQTAESKEPLWKRDVIPTSYELSDGVRCVSVTGLNTGGKTLAAKTLGVSVLMAKVGMFVPGVLQRSGDDGSMCHRIRYFDNVLADVGDDQSLVQSLSIFSGHVERIKRILAARTRESLVLLHEICSGTGIPSRSNALDIAERLGLNSSVIEEARFLQSLDRDKNAAEAAREDTERALREAKTMRSEKDQKSAMELEGKQAEKQIAKVIREMQKGSGSAQAAGRETEKLRKMKVPGAENSPSQVVPSESTNIDDLRGDDKVIVTRLSANEVEVVQKLSKNELMVAIEAMKAKVKVEEVASVN
ncbi:DNA mismatch repair protein MutS [Gracilaria domingensis]|nr:DNA mismatch repair protein MutS [Gracilaria domingensis]